MTMSSPASPLASTSARTLRRIVLVLLAALGSIAPAAAQTVDELRCGVLKTPRAFGPFDYRTATADQKYIVEVAHFDRENELLVRGTSQKAPGPDIAYTLRVFPNHPRALRSMMELRFRDKANPPWGMQYTAECWFNRALRFTPDDGQVRMLYGFFLLRSGDKKGAVEQLELAQASGIASANFQYNLGLAYFQVQDYEKARQQAYKAKELGYELDGLKKMLTKIGQWREPPPSAPKGDAPKAEEPAAQGAQDPKK